MDNVTLGFPRRLYEGGNEPPPGKSSNYRSKLELIPRLETFLGPELWEEVKNSPLGNVVKLHEQDFMWSSRIVHQLLTRQLATEKKYELWFLISNVPLRFTLKEYEEVTGLNCGPFPEEECRDTIEIGLFSKLEMKKTRVIPSLDEVIIGFETNVIQSRMDKLRAAYLTIVTSVIMGCDRRTSIPKHLVRLVNDLDRFVAYPWGREGFKALVDDVKRRDFSQHSYVLGGFAQVLQVWAYSLFPNVGDKVWGKLRDDGPTILRYKGSKAKLSLENLGEVDISGLEAENVEWEDEADDIHIDNILKYYEEHKSFEEVTWLPMADTTIKVPTLSVKGGKRKGKELEDSQGKAKSRKSQSRAEIESDSRAETESNSRAETEGSADGRDEEDGSAEPPKILTKAWGRRIERRIETMGQNIESSLQNMSALLSKILGDGYGAENDSPPSKSTEPKKAKGKSPVSEKKTPRKGPASVKKKDQTPPKAPTPKRDEQPQKEKDVVVPRRSRRFQVSPEKAEPKKKQKKTRGKLEEVESKNGGEADDESHIVGNEKAKPKKKQKKSRGKTAEVESEEGGQADDESHIVGNEKAEPKKKQKKTKGKTAELESEEGGQADDESHIAGILRELSTGADSPPKSHIAGNERELSTGADSPPKRAETVETMETVEARPLSLVLPTDSSCALVSTNTVLQEKATIRKVERVYSKRPKREKKKAPAKKSPFVTPPETAKKDLFFEVRPARVNDLNEFLERGRTNVSPIGYGVQMGEFFAILRQPRAYLVDYHIDAYLNVLRMRLKHEPELFPSTRIAFLDNALTMYWPVKYNEFLEDPTNFPCGALDYLTGKLPTYMSIEKRWGVDIDKLYGVVHIGSIDSGHWFGMIISIPDREITIVDSSPTLYSHQEIEAAVLPFAHMVPALLRYVAPTEHKRMMSTKPYTVLERDLTLPRNATPAGDCGVYALLFLELNAMGKKIPPSLNDDNMENIRLKMACDIFIDVFRYGSSTTLLHEEPVLSDNQNSVETINKM